MVKPRKEDYPELSNKPINWVFDDGEVVKAVVVHCNRAVGVTIVDKNYPTRKLTCLNGPSSKNYVVKNKTLYNRGFDLVIRGIKSGTYQSGELDKTLGLVGNGSMAACPFSGV